jgi:hypothetical protein
MNRTNHDVGLRQRVLRFAALLVLAWWVMTLTHELGHVVGGLVGGGRLQTLELRPWKLPLSIFQPDPHPLLTLWSGPILGVAVPYLVAALVRRPLAWFVADFCLLANGVYLAISW